MSAEYANRDPLSIARDAERDLNAPAAAGPKPTGTDTDTATAQDPDASGVQAPSADKFPGSTLTTGAASSGRQIPPEEGGDVVVSTGATSAPGPGEGDNTRRKGGQQRLTTDKDFEGEGGPEDKRALYEQERGGEDDVRGNIR